MNRLIALGMVTLAGTALVSGCAAKKNTACNGPCGFKGSASEKFAHYGAEMKLAADETVCIEDLLDNPKAYNGKVIRVCGRVDTVCAKKGCWLRLTGSPGRDTVFVKFTCPVQGRLVPMEAVGHQAIVEGTFTASEISEAEARHYAEDAKKSPAEIAKIVGPQRQLSMKSPAAMIRGI